ncbi:MAG: NHL repeat-containing protein [Gammaproteobacteria bacterium]
MNRALAIGLVCFAGLVRAEIPTADARHLYDLRGSVDNPLSLPTDVSVGDSGRVYVVDSGNDRVAVFSERGGRMETFSGPGRGSGRLLDPVGIGIGGNGDVYVADKGNARISVFSSDGVFRKLIPLFADGVPVAPVDVAVMPDGPALVVTGNSNHRVMVFDIDGGFVRAWGGSGINDGEFRYPATVAVDDDALIYVVDVLNTRVQRFSRRGQFQVQLGRWGVRPGQLFRPKGVAVDRARRVYVSDSYLGVVQVFDAESRFLHVLGRDAVPLRWSAPAGMDVDAEYRLFVAEMMANKVSVYSLRSGER